MRWALLILLIVSAYFLAGCGGLNEDRARETALDFVKSRVKFYSQDPGYVVGAEEYDYRFISGSQRGQDWVFLVNVSYTRTNETKAALIRIGIDSRTGQISSFEQIR